jgi:hypothetical protein
MNYRRFTLASFVIFLFAILWNGGVHLLLLREADSILTTFGRTESQRDLSLSILATLLLSMLFVWSYTRFAKRGTIAEGLTYGIFFGLLAGVLVDLNQYVLYPIPASLALSWFVFGLIEFSVYGVLVSRLYPIKLQAA